MEQIYHVLVVDDDTVLTSSIEYMLKSRGFCVTIANSGREALTLLKGGLDPDIILLDVIMPEMDGYDTFNAIQRIKYFPVIFISGNDDSTSELKGLTMGAMDYVTKPFIIDILIARINIHIHQAKQTGLVSESVERGHDGEPTARTISIGETDTLSVALDHDKLDNMKELLSESEYRIGKRIALGYTNKEIAKELNYSYGYVKKVAYRIFDKLDIKKRTELRNFFTK